MNTNTRIQKTSTLNARSYATFFDIAKKAIAAIEKIKNNRDYASDFTIQQLCIISYNHAFFTLENFFEHIGFVLCDDWESNGEQRNYSKKQKKLASAFMQIIITQERLPHINHSNLEAEWSQLINSINFKKYSPKRNPLTHIHSGKHDTKSQTIHSNNIGINFDEHEPLYDNTIFDDIYNDCIDLINTIEEFIQNICLFLKTNKIIFKIHNQAILYQERYSLFSTFLLNPWLSAPMTLSHGTIL